MSWAKFDDGYDDNPKCRAAGKDGRALDQAGIRLSARYLSDGLIPDHDLPVLAAKAEVNLKRTLSRLVDVGRWHGPGHDCDRCPECPPGHHVVHDYLSYNPTGEKERAKRQARSDAGRKGGLKSRPPRSNPEANSEAIASPNAQANGEAQPNPVPVPPVENKPPLQLTSARDPAAGEGSVTDQAIELAADRYVQHELDQGRNVADPLGLHKWWRQQNEQGARDRAERLLTDHDLTAIQLADVLASATDPRWLSAYRRRETAHEIGDVDHQKVASIIDGVRDRVQRPGAQP